MSEIVKSDIFFFITAVAVILVTVLLCVILYYLLKTVKSVGRIINRIELGSEVIAEDLTHARSRLIDNSIVALLSGVVGGITSGFKRHSEDDKETEDEAEELVSEDDLDMQLKALIKNK